MGKPDWQQAGLSARGRSSVSQGSVDTGARGTKNGKGEQIEDLLLRTRLAKADADQLGLTFEAYLLDMAVMALAERAQKKGSDGA